MSDTDGPSSLVTQQSSTPSTLVTPRSGGVVVGRCFIDGRPAPHRHEHPDLAPAFLWSGGDDRSGEASGQAEMENDANNGGGGSKASDNGSGSLPPPGDRPAAQAPARRAVIDTDGLRVSYRAAQRRKRMGELAIRWPTEPSGAAQSADEGEGWVSSSHAIVVEFAAVGPIQGLVFSGGTGAAQFARGGSFEPPPAASFVLAPPTPERTCSLAWEGLGGRRWMPCVDLPNARYLFRFRVVPWDSWSGPRSIGSATAAAAGSPESAAVAKHPRIGSKQQPPLVVIAPGPFQGRVLHGVTSVGAGGVTSGSG